MPIMSHDIILVYACNSNDACGSNDIHTHNDTHALDACTSNVIGTVYNYFHLYTPETENVSLASLACQNTRHYGL